ncbi:hypothetical protein GF359_08125 [candidate division WOR-3 bacterium]|uniref:Uncharacterized protein n=1 Tax=candidate division WOR-3 bacterium TaxID=2052148 RepID=A0A9D5K9Y8_UNCW3|nr:hypothetical protein [candidate division WOR-3 bacterium]MBD3365167.1 hypothetical protein [candidate division WOR-3 bacterium]
MTKALEDSLIDFFKHTTVSAAILKTFAAAGEPLKFDALIEGVGLRIGKRIPSYAVEGAVKNSLRLLKSSGWVVKEETQFALTDLGRELAERID